MTQQIKIMNIYGYTNTCMHAITTEQKRGHEVEDKWGKLYRSVWEGRENFLIKIFSILHKNAHLTPLLKGTDTVIF